MHQHVSLVVVLVLVLVVSLWLAYLGCVKDLIVVLLRWELFHAHSVADRLRHRLAHGLALRFTSHCASISLIIIRLIFRVSKRLELLHFLLDQLVVLQRLCWLDEFESFA